MSCSHFQQSRCTLGLYGGTPSPGVCAMCDQYCGPSRGAGDLVERAARITGFRILAQGIEGLTGKPCGCAERRAALNAAFPFADESSVP